jgi:DnaK suppressor protein
MIKKPYDPLSDKKYMSEKMRAYFGNVLKQKLEELEKRETRLKAELTPVEQKETDVTDIGSNLEQIREAAAAYAMVGREIQATEAAIRRLRDGLYGYCLATGDEIGVARLKANPVTTLCLEAQEQKEKKSRVVL